MMKTKLRLWPIWWPLFIYGVSSRYWRGENKPYVGTKGKGGSVQDVLMARCGVWGKVISCPACYKFIMLGPQNRETRLGEQRHCWRSSKLIGHGVSDIYSDNFLRWIRYCGPCGGVHCQTEYSDEGDEDDDVDETSPRFLVLSLTQMHKPSPIFHICYLSRRLSSFGSKWRVSAMHSAAPSSRLSWLHSARGGQVVRRYYFLRSFLVYQFKITKRLQKAAYPRLPEDLSLSGSTRSLIQPVSSGYPVVFQQCGRVITRNNACML